MIIIIGKHRKIGWTTLVPLEVRGDQPFKKLIVARCPENMTIFTICYVVREKAGV